VAGPWERYTPQPESSGPWNRYAPQQEGEQQPAQEAAQGPWSRYAPQPALDESPGIIGYGREALKQIGLGAATGIPLAARGVAGYGEREAGRELESAIEMAQRGILPGADEPIPAPRPAVPVEQVPLYQGAQELEKSIQKTIAPEGTLHPVAQEIFHGIGTTIPPVVGSFIPGVNLAVPGFLAAQGMGEAVDKAAKEKATPEQTAQAAQFGSIAGLTDLVDVLLPSLGSVGATMSFIKRVGTKAAIAAASEGLQEGTQQAMQNAIAKAFYKPDQSLMEDVVHSALIGGAVGGILGGVTAGRRQQPERTSEDIAAEFEKLGNLPPPPLAIPPTGTIEQPAAHIESYSIARPNMPPTAATVTIPPDGKAFMTLYDPSLAVTGQPPPQTDLTPYLTEGKSTEAAIAEVLNPANPTAVQVQKVSEGLVQVAGIRGGPTGVTAPPAPPTTPPPTDPDRAFLDQLMTPGAPGVLPTPAAPPTPQSGTSGVAKPGEPTPPVSEVPTRVNQAATHRIQVESDVADQDKRPYDPFDPAALAARGAAVQEETQNIINRMRRQRAEMRGEPIPTTAAEQLPLLSEKMPDTYSIEAQTGVNEAQAIKIVSRAYYGDLSNMTEITMKEMLQNSVDAVKPLLEQKKMSEGRIDITVDPAKRTITMKDDGTGMTPDVLAVPFFKVASSHKETGKAGGGFGFAKAQYVYANEGLTVTTLRNGVVSTVTTSGAQVMGSVGAQPTHSKPRIDVRKATPEDLRKFPKGHGTEVTVKIPATFQDDATGEIRPVRFPDYRTGYGVLTHSPLFQNIDVYFNGMPALDLTVTATGMGKQFPADKYARFADFKFKWGVIHVYTQKASEYFQASSNGHVLSNGIWQFNLQVKKDPNKQGNPIQHRFFFDVEPTAEVGTTGYPFVPNRMGFTQIAAKDFYAVTNYIAVMYHQENFNEAVKNFGDMQYLSAAPDGTMMASQKIKVEPKVPRRETPFAALMAQLQPGQTVEVIDGQMFVRGQKIPEITPEELAKVQIDWGSLKIDQDEINPDQPIFHDNVEVQTSGAHEEDFFKAVADILADPVKMQAMLDPTKPFFTPPAPTTDGGTKRAFGDIMRDEFGERFDRYMHDLGEMFIELRNVIAAEMDMLDMLRVGVGISIDPKYRGVSIRVPFIGVFVNPATPAYRDPMKAALDMYKTMIHELAHHKIRDHDSKFAAEMQNFDVRLDALETQIDGALTMATARPNATFSMIDFKRRIMNLVAQNQDINTSMYGVISGTLGPVTTRGERFSDVGIEQAGDGGVPGVAPAIGGPGGIPTGAPIGDSAGVADIRQESRPPNLSASTTSGASHDGGRARNTAAINRDGGGDIGGDPIQPETEGARASIANIFGGWRNVPPAVQASAAHADKITRRHQYLGGISQLVRANPLFEPLVRYWGRVKEMFIREAGIQYEGMMINRRWARMGDRGVSVAAYIDELGHMTYLSPQERVAGIVRHPTTGPNSETERLRQKHKMDAEMLDLVDDINLFIMGGQKLDPQGRPVGPVKMGFVEKMALSSIRQVQRNVARGKTSLATGQKNIQKIVDGLQALKKRPYFPFTNFGSHYIIMNDPSGRQIHYETIERGWISSRFASVENVQARRVNELSDYFRTTYNRSPTISDDPSVKSDIYFGVHPEHVGPLINLPNILLEQMQGTLQLTAEQMTAASNLRFAQVHDKLPLMRPRDVRKYYVPGFDMREQASGYSMDLRRSFARFVFHGAKYYVKSEYAAALNDDVRAAMQWPNNVVANNIGKFMRDHLDNTILDAKGDFGFAKGAIFLWAMGYSPAAAMQNLMQTPVITYPFLWKHFGLVRGSGATLNQIRKEMARAGQAMYNRFLGKPNPLAYRPTAFEYMAIEYATQTGRITETQAPENAAVAAGDILRGFGANKWHRGWQKFMERAAFLFEQAEQANRRIAFRAALNLAVKHNGKPFVDQAIKVHKFEYDKLVTSGIGGRGLSIPEARAIVAAIDAVEQTQYVYSRHDRSRIMRGRLPGTLFVFQKYLHDTLWLYGRDPGVGLRSMLMLFLIGGAGGLPMYDVVRSLVAGVGARWFGRDWDMNRWARRFIIDSVGGGIPPDLVLHGISRYGFGVPTILDLLGSTLTGTPGRGLAAPRTIRDPVTGELKMEGGRNISFPVFDRSKSVSLGNPFLIDLGKIIMPTPDNEKVALEEIQRASGAFFSVGFNIYKVMTDNHASWGDPKIWERMVPRAMGSAMEAMRWAYEGRERTHGGPAGGSTIANFNPRDPEMMAEIIGRALGYQPLRVQGKWDAVIDQQNAIKQIEIRRQGLMETYYEARKGQNREEIEKARQAVIQYNTDLPSYAAGRKISGEQLLESMRNRYKATTMREMGLPTQRTQVPIAREIQRLYPEAEVDVRRAPTR